MGSRILIQVIILLAPFAIYGFYRMAIAEAAAEGKAPWPIFRLFVIGFALTLIVWVVLLVLDKQAASGDMCPGVRELVNGEVVQRPDVPCERDVSGIGIPASEDPGARDTLTEPASEGDE